MELLNTEKIESRRYQIEIAQAASKDSTMVVLPTGLGKTVIAAIIAAKKVEEGKLLFLAPTKPLVSQHRKTFEEFLDLEDEDLKVMTGEVRPDEREEMWSSGRIFFGTPQVVENDLISGNVPVSDFASVFFDECHRATGEYSYVYIAERFRCHRLGLTASPGGSREEIMTVAENLGIENFEVRTENDEDVKPYIEDKQVNWKRVALNNTFESARKKLVESRRKPLKELKKNDFISSLDVNKSDILQLQGEIRSKLSKSDDPKLYSAISSAAAALKISQAIELLETQGVSQCYDYMKGLENDDSKAAKRALNDDDFVKARSLVEYLKKEGEEHPKVEEVKKILSGLDGKAIVFTEYRSTADTLLEELSEKHEPRKFVGQRGDDGMTQSEQIETLEEFGNGEFDVLVSTSIGEEGLDVPSVDKVIFFEPVSSSIRDIQRMGRTGRQSSGEVHVLIAEDTRDEAYYWKAQNEKKQMQKVLEGLQDEQLEQKTLDGFEEKGLEIVADDRENLIAKKLSRKAEVDKRRLEVGDFFLSDRVVVERKEASDFVDSIVDNRLFDQLGELSDHAHPVLLIEGKDLYSHRNIDENAIRGALASISLDYRIPVLWTEDAENTARTLVQFAKREQEENDREVTVRDNSNGTTPQQEKEFLVAGLPGVNTKLARSLLREFGSPGEVFKASREQLMDVKGLGEKKADRIREILEESYS